MKMISLILCICLSSGVSLRAQYWKAEAEISFRIDVARPVAAAVGVDGGLVVADGQTLALHFIHPVTGDDRVVMPPKAGWASIKDLAVLPDSTVLILDSHNGKTWRLNGAGRVQSVSLWQLPFALYQAEILLAGPWGEWVRLRQTRVGEAGLRHSFLRRINRSGRELMRLGPFPDGAVAYRASETGRRQGVEATGALRDSWAASGQAALLFHGDGRSGVVAVYNQEGIFQHRFSSGRALGAVDTLTRQWCIGDARTGTVPDSLTAMRKIAVDGMGQLWVMTGERALQRHRWMERVLLFTVHGQPLGTLWIDFEPAAFFMDRVFTLRPDAARGETVVRRYRTFPVVAHIP